MSVTAAAHWRQRNPRRVYRALGASNRPFTARLEAAAEMRWLALMTACTLASVPCPTAQAQPAEEQSRRPIVVEVRDSGFDWADAGIGGAAVG